MKNWSLIIYIPAYNVENSITELIDRINKTSKSIKPILKSVVVINDGSTDKTQEILEKLKNQYKFLKVVNKKKNKGVVSAIFDGIDESLKLVKIQKMDIENTIILRMDSDLEHQPEDVPKTIEPIVKEKSSICVGYVPIDSRNGKEFSEFSKKYGLLWSRKFLNLKIPQFWPGFTTVRADLLKALVPEIKNAGHKFKKQTKKDFLAIDFFTLIDAKLRGEKISVVKLRKIEDKWIKKHPKTIATIVIILFLVLFILPQTKKELNIKVVEVKDVPTNITKTMYEYTPMKVAFSEYIDNKEKFDNTNVTLIGYLRYKLEGTETIGVYNEYLVDYFDNEIRLQNIPQQYRKFFIKKQTTNEVYNVTGTFKRKYKNAELDVSKIILAEKPMQVISK